MNFVMRNKYERVVIVSLEIFFTKILFDLVDIVLLILPVKNKKYYFILFQCYLKCEGVFSSNTTRCVIRSKRILPKKNYFSKKRFFLQNIVDRSRD